MNISNFKEQVPLVMLARGLNYFKNGIVASITQVSDGRWLAQLSGNYGDYDVDIEMDENGDISDYFCNCPYDGAICKHVVAVLFSIEKEQGKGETNTAKKDSWQELLKNADEEALRDFVFEFAARNKDFRHEFVIQFSQPSLEENNTAYYQNLVSLVVEKYSHRGYLDYRATLTCISDKETKLMRQTIMDWFEHKEKLIEQHNEAVDADYIVEWT